MMRHAPGDWLDRSLRVHLPCADSGVVAHLQSALDIASQGDCQGAKAAALGLTDFVSIAERNVQPDAAPTAAGHQTGAARLPCCRRACAPAGACSLTALISLWLSHNIHTSTGRLLS